jgi:hypothetical protein
MVAPEGSAATFLRSADRNKPVEAMPGGMAVPAANLNVGEASVVAGPKFFHAQREKPTDMGTQQGLDNLAAATNAIAGSGPRGGTTFFTPDHKTIQQDQFRKQSEGNARLQRSFLSPKDRKKLETDERRAYDRQFMGDKLTAAKDIETTKAGAMVNVATQAKEGTIGAATQNKEGEIGAATQAKEGAIGASQNDSKARIEAARLQAKADRAKAQAAADAEKYKADQDRKKTEFPYGPDAKLSQTDAQGNVILAPGASTPTREPGQKVRVPAVDDKGNPLFDNAGKPIYTDTIVFPSQMRGEERGAGSTMTERNSAADAYLEDMGTGNGFLFANRLFGNRYVGKDADVQARAAEIRQGEKAQSPASTAALSPDDIAALEWAKANPEDPRSAKILQRLNR